MRHLHARGHEIHLAALNTTKHRQDPAVLKDVTAVHTLDIDTDLRPWGLLKSFFDARPYNVMRFWSQTFAEMLTDLVKKENFDVIQLEGSYLSLYIKVLRAHSSAPIVLRSHNVEHQIWARHAAAEGNFVKRSYLKMLAPKIARFELNHRDSYDGIAAITDQDADWYRKNDFSSIVRTVSAGVDLERFDSANPPAFQPKICFLGSLEWKPNEQGLLWFLEHVWDSLHELHPESELHVAGKNPPSHLRQMDIPGMTFHGMVPDAAEFLDRYHIFIVPLLSGGGMRIKILEAMANGKCVISTAVGAEGIPAVNEKEIYIENEAADWFARLTNLLTSGEESVQVAVQGKRFVEKNYTWEAKIDQLEALYREVMR